MRGVGKPSDRQRRGLLRFVRRVFASRYILLALVY